MGFLIRFAKGCMLGITAVIPGLSVGTMALLLDVYEKCIEHVVVFVNPRNWRNSTRCKNALLFLLPLVLGALSSVFVASKFLLALFEHYRIFLQFVFFGMICGSIPHLFKSYIAPLYRGGTWLWLCVYCAIGFTLMYFLSGSSELTLQGREVLFSLAHALKALVYGIIGAAAGVVPGISGSYVLLLMGYYETFLYIMSAPVLSLLVFFLIGSIVGLLCIALLVNFLFHKFSAASYSVILGIIIGSLFRVISIEQVVLFTMRQFLIALACVFCGAFFMTVVSIFQNMHVQNLKQP